VSITTFRFICYTVSWISQSQWHTESYLRDSK